METNVKVKTPKGLLDVKGSSGKGEVQITSCNDVDLQEFGVTVEEDTTTCYALTSPGDIFTISFAFNPGVAGFVDLIVDGVRRNKIASAENLKGTFRGKFTRAFYQGRVGSTEKRSGLKSCQMKVRARNGQPGKKFKVYCGA